MTITGRARKLNWEPIFEGQSIKIYLTAEGDMPTVDDEPVDGSVIGSLGIIFLNETLPFDRMAKVLFHELAELSWVHTVGRDGSAKDEHRNMSVAMDRLYGCLQQTGQLTLEEKLGKEVRRLEQQEEAERRNAELSTST